LNRNVFIALILIPSFVSSVFISYKFSVQDTRSIAYNWVQENLDDSKDFLYVHGEELSFVPFQKNNTKKIPKIDRSRIGSDSPMPFYLVIGKNGVTLADVTKGDLDPDTLRGNSAPILKNAELMLYANNKYRYGPPIYIFKVSKIGD